MLDQPEVASSLPPRFSREADEVGLGASHPHERLRLHGIYTIGYGLFKLLGRQRQPTLSADPTAVDPETLDQLKVVETIKEGLTVFQLTAEAKRQGELLPGIPIHPRGDRESPEVSARPVDSGR